MLQRKVQVAWEWEVVMMENNRKMNKLLKNPEEKKQLKRNKTKTPKIKLSYLLEKISK